MNNIIKDRISLLREKMEENGIDWYFFTSDDYHASEYIADFFKIREFYSGFTGENAFLLISMTKAFLWTDGRFFIQAEKELAGTDIKLMKMGEPDVPTVADFVKNNIQNKETLCFDGRMVSASWGKKLESVLDRESKLVYDKDYAGELWADRPDMPSSKLAIIPDSSTGESIANKLVRIREEMAKLNVTGHFIGSLDDIAWITNIRGNDIECNPVFLSYMYLTSDSAYIFMQKSEITGEVTEYLNKAGITIKDYDDIIDFLSKNDYSGPVLCDEGGINYSSYRKIKDKTEVVNKINPSKRFKSIKNEVEIERLKEAYLEDSVCVTKFLYWIKKAVKTEKHTEISAADYIDNLRKNVKGFLDFSFPTISGYAENGAIVHYAVSEESNKELKPEGMLLVDSGGQYEKGTTDVTRTVSLGPVTDKMKLCYTKTAIGMLSLANIRFLHGCTGRNLDIIARQPLWNINIDYKHGTGHGIGYILNVHEGPQNIRWQYNEGATEYAFESGMVTSDEPGVYIEGEFGIRIENIILCVDDVTNSNGRFHKFEHLTFAPLDRALLDKSVLTQGEIELVNEYQELVYTKMKGHLSKEEELWLRNETLPL